MFRFKSPVAIRSLVFSICLATVGCGSDSGSRAVTPTSPTSAPAPALNVAGTWTGTLTIPGESRAVPIKSWTATQTGASVSGPVVVDAGDGNVQATLTGTISGGQLTSATFTVPAAGNSGSLSPGCSFSGTGTLAATTSSVSGPLAMTFPPACVGPENVSDTPTATWTFSLTK